MDAREQTGPQARTGTPRELLHVGLASGIMGHTSNPTRDGHELQRWARNQLARRSARGGALLHLKPRC